MMYDVIMSDIMKEETALPSKKVSINSGSGTPLEVPLLAAIMRQDRIGMV